MQRNRRPVRSRSLASNILVVFVRFMNLASTNELFEVRRQKSLQRCNDQIAWYEKTKSSTRALHLFLTISTIALGGVTPVLILWSDLPKPLQALPSALAAMTVAFDRAFRPRENYARMSYFSETLKSEIFKYETRTTEDYGQTVDEDKALDNFAKKVDALMNNEISEWIVLSKASDLGKKD